MGKCEFDSADSPKCWGDFNINTDYNETIPETNVTREYWLEATNHTGSADGIDHLIHSINGTVPGPTIHADWGDWVVVHVTNKLANNGTSIHWHGIRQLLTSQEDGVVFITQCPTAPGDSITYMWRATHQYALQAWNGVFGGIVINGPATTPHDEDKGILFLNDWHHTTTDALWQIAETPGLPPPAANALINSTNIYTNKTSGDMTGARFETTFTSAAHHRLRVINGAIDSHFKFSIDGHNMTVIANDLVAIEPFTTAVLSVGIGQRYDIIVEANQAVGDYWTRAAIDTFYSATNEMQDNILGVVRYDPSSTADPESTAYAWTDDCVDEDMDNLVPHLQIDAGASSVIKAFDVALDFSTGVTRWTINGTSFRSGWEEPTLEQAMDDVAVFEDAQQVVRFEVVDEWVYFVIESTLAITQPVHLHGHDFFVLAQEAGATYDVATVNLTTTNLTRRDVAMLPAAGYLVIGFRLDNPDVWLMHCHIGWHASEGFALQIIERSSEIEATVDRQKLSDQCSTWDNYVSSSNIEQEDPGI
ncbi:multicopper oxidase [Truncatella angustata]|uniref:Multicopper oxidase n=1 Tax=Truncatella angustata TaxID=152316 RepID=A0A9P8UE13_9PEZI|nr:multicopper oxidase [Truncatella angustata]KAH6648191.1 multicopper oxidase [Truncatella angustata]